jgi:hypothetical protein
MANEYSNNLRDGLEERFSKLEAQVSDISYKRGIITVAVERNF